MQLIKKASFIAILLLLMMDSLSGGPPFAKWTDSELILNNGIVQRIIRLPSAGGNYLTIIYKPVEGNFNYFSSLIQEMGTGG